MAKLFGKLIARGVLHGEWVRKMMTLMQLVRLERRWGAMILPNQEVPAIVMH
jgi:hypothetical protein